MDMRKMDHLRIDDLQLRPDMFSVRLQRRARLRAQIAQLRGRHRARRWRTRSLTNTTNRR